MNNKELEDLEKEVDKLIKTSDIKNRLEFVLVLSILGISLFSVVYFTWIVASVVESFFKVGI